MDVANTALTPYPAYKHSGVPWLGEIPAHWRIQPGFSTIREKQHKNTGMAETTVLSLSYGRIVIKPPEKLHGLVPASFETYQIVDPGDIIIRPTDLQNDWTSLRVGIARDRGIITSAYICLRTVGPIIPEYAYLLLHAYDLMKVFYGMGSGLRQNLDFTDLKRMPVLVLPLEEQHRIAAFLDHIDRRVSRLIRVKRRMIALLNEQKQAIIHRAVTRGLDPDVRLKPSGVEWLGEVPEHWEVRRLKALSPRISGRLVYQPAQYFSEDGVPFIMANNVTPDGIKWEGVKHIPLEVNERFAHHALREGDVITVRVGAPGTTCVVPEEADGLNFASLMITRRSARFHSQWLAYVMNSGVVRSQIALVQYGAAQEQINIEDARNFFLPVPPLDEQKCIASTVADLTAPLDHARATAQREIDLIREYRTRLIADVVTGKLDVRGVDLAAYGDAPAEIDESLADEDDAGDEELELVDEADEYTD